jgi:hypothetical protein
VVLSFSELDWGPTSAIEGALRWRNWVEAGREAGKELGSERYKEIRYEDLVADPERVLRGLCAFLALDYEGSMFDYVERAEEIIAPNYYPEGHARIRLPPTAGLRDWRTQMKREDLVKFELVAGDVLEELGYERAVPAASAKRPRESDDEQVEGAPAIETGQDVELGDELPALIEEMNFLRKRVHRLSYRSRRAIAQRERAERRGERKLATATRRHESELRRHDRRAERKIANLERRRQTAVRRRKKVERTLRGLEETRWWQFRLRMRRLFAPLDAVRARRRLR